MEAVNRLTKRYSLKPRRHVGPVGLVVRLLASVVLVHFGWYVYERLRFAAAVDAIHARAEPVLVEDFNKPAPADPEDPVPLWRNAAMAVGDDVLGALKVEEVELPLTEREKQEFGEVVDENRDVLLRARIAAAKKGRSCWCYRFTVPSFDDSHPEINPQRLTSQMLCMQAFYAHETGDDAGAFEAVELVRCQQDALYQYPDYTGYLTALDSGAKAGTVLWRILPTLRIRAEGSADEHAVPAARVRELIDELLDERPLDQSIRRVCRAWRMEAASDSIHLFSGHKEWWIRTIASYVWAPRGYQEALDWLDAATQIPDAGSKTRWPSCKTQLEQLNVRPDLNRSIFSFKADKWRRGLRQNYLYRTGSRITAVALAMRLYATEHEGEFPATLGQLVPRYLPCVPADPMATNASLRYKVGDDPVIYSVGDNGIDDGGNGEVNDEKDSEFFNCCKDIVLHLRGEKRTAPADYFVHDGLQFRQVMVIPWDQPVRPASSEKR